MIKGQLVLIKLRENCTDVEMSVSLDFWALEPRFNRKSTLQEIESCAHFANSTIVASHVVEGHSLTKLVVFTELFRLLQQVQSAIDVFFLEVVDSEDVADLAQLLAGSCELFRSRAKVHFLDFKELFKDANCFNILALQ